MGLIYRDVNIHGGKQRNQSGGGLLDQATGLLLQGGLLCGGALVTMEVVKKLKRKKKSEK